LTPGNPRGARLVSQEAVDALFHESLLPAPDAGLRRAGLAHVGVLIVILVVVGSLLIMADLNDNMMPAAELMNLQMQH
jgi:cytochrome o ubiquinol oxidase subunit IV